jgi:hypothetical protein
MRTAVHASKTRLGHSTITMLMDTYGHLFPQSDDASFTTSARPANRLIPLRGSRRFGPRHVAVEGYAMQLATDEFQRVTADRSEGVRRGCTPQCRAPAGSSMRMASRIARIL